VGSNPTLSASPFIGSDPVVLPESCQEPEQVGPNEPNVMTKQGRLKKSLDLSKRAVRLGIKIRRVPNRSRGREFGHSWLVVIPAKVTGQGRLRRQFEAAEAREAVDFAEAAALKAKELGQTAFLLSPEEVTEARRALRRLEGLGLTLSEAADFAARHLRPIGGDATLSQVLERLMQAKREKNLRPASLESLKKYAGRIVRTFGEETAVKSVTAEQLKSWIRASAAAGSSARLVRNIAAYTRQFFRFALQEKLIVSDPAVGLRPEGRLEDEKSISVLSVEQTKALLRTAMLEKHRDLLPAMVLSLFCGGIRSEELTRLRWSDVDLTAGTVTLEGRQTKTRQRRKCEIPAKAREFLMLHPKRQGPITPARFELRASQLYLDAGFKNWKRDYANAKRHSFGTYASKLHDWAWVVDQMGNSVGILIRHYRDASVSREDANAYFEISTENLSIGAEVIEIPKGA
jgi:integrase